MFGAIALFRAHRICTQQQEIIRAAEHLLKVWNFVFLILFINNNINRIYLFYLAKHSRSKNMAYLVFFRIGWINRGGGRVAPNICRISDCWQRFFWRRYTTADDPWFMSLSTFTSFLSVLINFLSNCINSYKSLFGGIQEGAASN